MTTSTKSKPKAVIDTGNLEISRTIAAEVLGLSERSLSRHGAAIPGARKVGRSWRYSLPKLVHWYAKQKVSEVVGTETDYLEDVRRLKARKLELEMRDKSSEHYRIVDLKRVIESEGKTYGDAYRRIHKFGKTAIEIADRAVEKIIAELKRYTSQ